jgi:hypothetical protein
LLFFVEGTGKVVSRKQWPAHISIRGINKRRALYR